MARTRGGSPAQARGPANSPDPVVVQPPNDGNQTTEEEQTSTSSASSNAATSHSSFSEAVPKRLLQEHTDSQGKVWFSSNWQTQFVFCLATQYPWRAANTYVEVALDGGTLTPADVMSIRIHSSGTGKWLARLAGKPSDLWLLIYEREPEPMAVLSSANSGSDAGFIVVQGS